jgi:hypothetical protein
MRAQILFAYTQPPLPAVSLLFLLKYLWLPRSANYEGPRQESTKVRSCRGCLSYLTVMVTGVEWLSDPDVPVTVNVT